MIDDTRTDTRRVRICSRAGCNFTGAKRLGADPRIRGWCWSGATTSSTRRCMKLLRQNGRPSDDAAEAAAQPQANPNARKSYRSGNKWHESVDASPEQSRRNCGGFYSPQHNPMRGRADLPRLKRIQRCDRAISGNLDAVRSALSCGADVSFAGMYGRTPLITAAMHGHTDIVSEIAYARSTNRCSGLCKGTALMYAGRWGLGDIVQLLFLSRRR